jgi:hypothetical protein
MIRSLRRLCPLLALAFAVASSAQTYYSVTGGGGQLQIGNGLPVPIQPYFTYFGAPIGTKSKFPPLLISVNPDPAKALVKQTGASPALIKVPPGVLRRVPTAPQVLGVAKANPKVFQARTKLSFSGPAKGPGPRTFKKDGIRTKAVTFAGAPAGSAIFYSGSIHRFGGAAQFRIGDLSKVAVWLNPGAMLPCKHPAFGGANGSCVAIKVPAHVMTLAAPGGAMTSAGVVVGGTTVTTPGKPPFKPNVFLASIPNTTGLIKKSSNAMATQYSITNMATSIGFPWTTGMIVISQPSAFGSETRFTITGMDSRTPMGAGTISLVAGALSERAITGPNANRAWARYTLPEPGAALGAAVALAALAFGHALAQRRSR